MDQQTQSRSSGSYTANLLGNIRSHLAGLQGYDVMALELIQNADDAKALSVFFDVTDQGLVVLIAGSSPTVANWTGRAHLLSKVTISVTTTESRMSKPCLRKILRFIAQRR
jgi:hypothetical protein